jgi:hypothetical protein
MFRNRLSLSWSNTILNGSVDDSQRILFVFYDDELFLIFSIITIISFEVLPSFRFFFYFLDLITKSGFKFLLCFVALITTNIRVIIINLTNMFFFVLSGCFLGLFSFFNDFNLLLLGFYFFDFHGWIFLIFPTSYFSIQMVNSHLVFINII